jgi:hypothetical protein
MATSSIQTVLIFLKQDWNAAIHKIYKHILYITSSNENVFVCYVYLHE